MTREKIRILYYYSHHHFDTGSPKALIGMVDLLDTSRHEPLFFADGDGPLLPALRSRGVEIVGGEVRRIDWRRPLSSLRRVRQHAAELRRLRIDVLHVNELGNNLDLVFGARLAGVRVVLHVHNPERIPLTNLHWLAANRVVFASRHALSAVEPRGILRGKQRVIPNSLERLPRAPRSIRASLGLGDQDLIIGSIAQLTPEKGTDVVLECAARLLPRYGRRLHFLLAGRVGEGAEGFVERMKARAGLPDLDGQIHFLGIRSDVCDLLASLDLFLLPTQAEIFCVAVLEALAAGLPVVASDVSALRELIPRPDLGVLVRAGDVNAFTAAVTAVLDSPDRGRGMGERARLSLSGRFDRGAASRLLHQLYDEVSGSLNPTRSGQQLEEAISFDLGDRVPHTGSFDDRLS